MRSHKDNKSANEPAVKGWMIKLKQIDRGSKV